MEVAYAKSKEDEDEEMPEAMSRERRARPGPMDGMMGKIGRDGGHVTWASASPVTRRAS